MKKMSRVLVFLAAIAWLAAPLAASGLTPQTSIASPVQTVEVAIGPISEQCGDVICSKGTVCCNPTCNLCLPPDMSCTQEVCNGSETSQESEPLLDAVEPAPGAAPEPQEPKKLELMDPPFEDCNEVVCGPGFYCCNFSCSICAPDGGFCTQQVCE